MKKNIIQHIITNTNYVRDSCGFGSEKHFSFKHFLKRILLTKNCESVFEGL